MNANWKKLLSLLLVLTMLVGMMPAVFAAEEEPATEPEQAEEILPEEPADPEIPDAPEVPAGPDTPDDPAEPEPSVTPEDPADPADPANPEAPADPEEPEVPEEPEEEPEEEEEEPAELPYGFPGMGEGYELSEEELAAKLAMAGLPETLAGMIPGADYVEGELMFLTDSADYAQQVADAYDAELLLFDGFFALIRLRSATVLQAVECAADPEIPLPAVEPNYIGQGAGLPADALSADDFSVQGDHMDWEDWDFTDDWVSDPSNNYNYQYHHDILDDYAAWGASDGSGASVAVISTYMNGSSSASRYSQLKELIAAPRDGSAGIGVAYNAGVGDFTPTACTDAAVITKLNAVIGNSAYKIVLLDYISSGGDGLLYSRVKALIDNGKIVIAPMGDNGASLSPVPACFSGVISVAATNPDGTLTSNSNFGSCCDISAPGISPPGVAYPSGTSYAAALVAGAAALYVSRYTTTAGFEEAMKQAASRGGAGAGILNTAKLFGGKPGDFELDEFSFYGSYCKTENGVVEVSEDGDFYFHFMSGPEDDTASFVYSLDGKNPSMKNGAVSHGSGADPWEIIKLTDLDLKLGKTYTLKVVAVNGLGVPGKVKSIKFRLVESDLFVYPDITNWASGDALAAGGSYTFKAEVSCSNSSLQFTQNVTWRIEQDPADLGAKIDAKTGKLTTKAGKEGTVWVYAKCANAKSSGTFYEDVVTVNVRLIGKVKTLTLDKKSVTLNLTNICEDPYEVQWLYATLKDSTGTVLYPSDGDVGLCWTSSNPDVVTVTDSFYSEAVQLIPYRKGTATITATAMDGSGKSASCKVTVIQHPAGVDIYYKDPDTYVPLPPLVPGGSVQLSAQVTGYYLTEKANDQRVTWDLDPYTSIPPELDGMVTVTPKGQVKLSKKAAPSMPYTIWVRATAKDAKYYPVSDSFPVEVRPKAKSFHMSYMGPLTYPDYYRFKGEKTTGVTLLTADLPATSAWENRIYITSYYIDACGSNWQDYTVSSSKPAVAAAYVESGEVAILAKSPGSCTVTVKSIDGAIKHSFPVKVINPIGSVRIASAGPGGANAVAFGKSLKLAASTLSTYGKPTNTKLTWRIVSVWDTHYHSLSAEEYKNVLSISKSGVLTVKKGAANLDLQSANVVVYPTDYTPYNSYTDAELAGLSLNSDLFDRFTVYFTEPVTKLSCDTPKTVQLNDEFPSASYTVTLNDGSVQCPHTGSVNNLISVTSSKPNLVSVQVTRIGSTSSASYLAKYTLKLTGHTGGLGGVGKSDTAKITVKAVDGSGKTFSFNVKVTSTMSG